MIELLKSLVEIVKTFFGSFFGVDLSYYPRRAGGKGGISSKEMIDSIRNALDGFSFDSADPAKPFDPKLLMDRAKDSLEEAKKQTEYQDGKAGRLLTIVAFLTAAVGTVFAKFVDIYPLQPAAAAVPTPSLVTWTYLLFGVYLLLVAAGAMVTFHAMSTRFVWPSGSLAEKDEVLSLLFFREMMRTKPEAWGKAFAGDKNELLRMYYKNYVSEAYLVAAKVADKVRYLDPGQKLLLCGMRVLLALFIMIMVTFAQVTPTKAAEKQIGSTGTSATTPTPTPVESAAERPGSATVGPADRARGPAAKAPAQAASGK